MYIAHNVTSLPIAAAAAEIKGVPLGFDVEDYHFDEESPSDDGQYHRALKSYLMRKYLPRCSYLSATSNLMADAIAEEIGVSRPVAIYNAFPISQSAGVRPPALRTLPDKQEPFTAYWFSHAVGLDRGLQDFIMAMPRLKRRVDLYLRGQVGEETKSKLLALADDLGVRERIFFLPVIAADELIKDAARFDFGLALEQPVNKNRQITITNKLFTYLLAGIIPVATATPGQREVMDQIAGIGVLYRPSAVDELVIRMNQFTNSQQLMLETKEAAWAAARARFCWDVEKHKLINAVESVVRSARSRRT
jgi:glycosyltransferase involved in cell wall biosynthesis